MWAWPCALFEMAFEIADGVIARVSVAERVATSLALASSNIESFISRANLG
jgi:hypothetical protein